MSNETHLLVCRIGSVSRLPKHLNWTLGVNSLEKQKPLAWTCWIVIVSYKETELCITVGVNTFYSRVLSSKSLRSVSKLRNNLHVNLSIRDIRTDCDGKDILLRGRQLYPRLTHTTVRGRGLKRCSLFKGHLNIGNVQFTSKSRRIMLHYTLKPGQQPLWLHTICASACYITHIHDQRPRTRDTMIKILASVRLYHITLLGER